MPTSVENLAIVWACLDRLCSDLRDSDWDLPTGCPGWTVKDHLSHLVDYEARALGRTAPEHDPGPRAYLKNDMGRANEVGVDARRPVPGPAVLEEFREVTAERLAQLGRHALPYLRNIRLGLTACLDPFGERHRKSKSRRRLQPDRASAESSAGPIRPHRPRR